MKVSSFIICALLSISIYSNGQIKSNEYSRERKEKGYLIYDVTDAVFIPSREIKDNLFLNRYRGDTGFRVGNDNVALRLQELTKGYEVVTNYEINGNPRPEKKTIRMIPVKIQYEYLEPINKLSHTDILFTYLGKDYIFYFYSDVTLKINSILPVRRVDKKRYKKQVTKRSRSSGNEQ